MFFDFASGMQAAGHEVRVITSSSGDLHGYNKYEGLDVWYCDWKGFFGHPLPKKNDIEEHLKWADVIHTSTITPGPIVVKCAHKLGKKCIISVHEVLGRRWWWIEKNPILALGYYIVERFVVTRAYDAYHVDSNATGRDLEKVKVNKTIQTIYLPVEAVSWNGNVEESISDFFQISATDSTFLFYGRPGQPKGIFVYLEAIRLLKERNTIGNAKFCFLMSNDPIKQRNKFCELVEKYDLKECVKIHESVKRDKLFSLISQADYVVVPSITEGFGFSAVEACYMGKKLICSDAGSLPEVVFGDVAFFQNRNSEDCADVLKKVIQEENVFEHIQKKDYSLLPLIKEMEAFYLQQGMN